MITSYFINNKEVPPLIYSNGKSQEDIIMECLDAFRDSDIVSMFGMVGSGKSVIAVAVAGLMGRGIVLVPTKILQQQYSEKTYSDSNYVRIGSKRLKVGVLKGRANFICPLSNSPCNYNKLPCTRPLNKLEHETRIQALQGCKYFGMVYPFVPKKITELIDLYPDLVYEVYETHGGYGALFYREGEGSCPYITQFRSYIDSDVIVMNSAKWMIETLMKRKPKTQVEIIDEGDLWLDSLSFKTFLGERLFSRVERSINQANAKNKKKIKPDSLLALRRLFRSCMNDMAEPMDVVEKTVEMLKEYDMSGFEDESMKLSQLVDFRDIVDVVKNMSLEFYVAQPSVTLDALRKISADKILLLSATKHSQFVLNDVFGIDPAIIYGEEEYPGTIYSKKIGTEQYVNYRNWQQLYFQERYFIALNNCVINATRPTYVNVHAKKYVPPSQAIASEDDTNDFLSGKQDIIWATTFDRGVSLDDGLCRSMIMLKYPYGDFSDPLMQSMKKRLGDKVFDRYKDDIARREFIQAIGRGLRHPDDYCEFLSPDSLCHDNLKRYWTGKIVEVE